MVHIWISIWEVQFKKKFFVYEENYDKAIELISDIFSNNKSEEEYDGEKEEIEDGDEELKSDEELEETEEDYDYNKRYRMSRRFLGLFFFVLPILIIILCIIANSFK